MSRTIDQFPGVAPHDRAPHVARLKLKGDKLALPGATKDALKDAQQFEYAREYAR